MAQFTLVNSFKEALAEKAHNLGSDQFVIALTNTLPNVANTQLSDIVQSSYTNLSPRNITTTSSSQTAGAYKLVFDPLVLSASGNVATFRYVVIYNDTSASDLLVGFADHGSSVTLTSGQTYTINFSGAAGIIAF